MAWISEYVILLEHAIKRSKPEDMRRAVVEQPAAGQVSRAAALLAFAPHREQSTAPGTDRRTVMFIARTLQDIFHYREFFRHQQPASEGGPDKLALIPTMGSLHAGHLSLLQAARRDGYRAAVSIFVNPTQFDDAGDLARYPRDEDADLALLDAAGCHLVWLPSVETMYPGISDVRIEIAGPALGWEGDVRPGHFGGVATVVTKLVNQIRPVCAYFGEKDWQQLQVIRSVVAGLFIPVAIKGVATMREADGLAMSSRNRFLDTVERGRAASLYRCLLRAGQAIAEGDAVPVVLDTAREDLLLRGFEIDYLALVDGSSLSMVTQLVPHARLIAAVRLGSVRLLDNIPIVERP